MTLGLLCASSLMVCTPPKTKSLLLYHRDDRSITAMAGRVIAAEFRRIEPRRLASIEKKGIPAAEGAGKLRHI